MVPSINPNSVTSHPLVQSNPALQPTESGMPVDFQKMLFDSIQQTSDMANTAEANVEARLLGEDITSAEVFTSMRKADLAMKMMMQVRNKLVSAFQEVQQMRM
ncbi:flagellar hook-basal body complex protein FliE [Rubinisphaera margarita]|uniref:flagellar hook-basal body complex protein FliE n=1 Tax=Rubinisphaera margarita TaxID=2909586 RepID=UPI001EE784E2|nr:flagellar hook-basal body complex protein FliE [Rubinisphaera margarita]MCG6154503.1 flagellar hook-basal body complex protein FliE [Rubinisphaera margarita]